MGNRFEASASQWRHIEHVGISNHQPHNCLLNSSFRLRSEKTSKLRVTGLCAGNSWVTGEFPAQIASNVENGSIWWRHHAGITCAQWQYKAPMLIPVVLHTHSYYSNINGICNVTVLSRVCMCVASGRRNIDMIIFAIIAKHLNNRQVVLTFASDTFQNMRLKKQNRPTWIYMSRDFGSTLVPAHESA